MPIPRLAPPDPLAPAPSRTVRMTGGPAPDRGRRTLIVAGLLASAAGGLARRATAADAPKVEVFKDPSCGCCQAWIEHLKSAGFAVTAREVGNTAARARAGIAPRYGSCHTAFVEGYAIEGHVPAEDVRRLLAKRPNAIGLAVPGMPIGSPGMDGPEYGGRRDRYEVLLIARDGSATVFSRHG